MIYFVKINFYINIFSNIAQWLENHSRPCFYKKYFGFECPGCGFQRALIELLRGNVFDSIKQFPALIPLLLMFTMLLIHLKFRLARGPLIIIILFILSIILIIGNFIVKLTLN